MTDADCASGGFLASCEPAESGKKWCAAHVDVDVCDSGLKWGSLAGDGLASTCVQTVADAGPGDGGIDGAFDGGPDGGPWPAPVPRSPLNGASTGSVWAPQVGPASPLLPRFHWQAVDGVQRFELQISDNCAPDDFAACPFLDPRLDISTAETTYQAVEPLPVSLETPVGRRYYWRVRACEVGATCYAWSKVRYVDVGRQKNDFDGDGYADIVVGAPGPFGGTRLGRIYIYWGGPGMTAFTTAPTVLTFATATRMGASVASAGDVNGDGISDLLVGAPDSAGKGEAYLYLGDRQRHLGAPDLTLRGATGSHLGASVASAGDVNGDGRADFVVGAPGSQIGPVEGQAFLYTGADDALADAMLADTGTQLQFGTVVSSAGDLNGDGYSDVAIAATLSRRVLVYLGSPGTFDATADGEIVLGQYATSLAPIGTFELDGHSSLLVGTRHDLLIGTGEGSTHFFAGGEPLALIENVTFDLSNGGPVGTGDLNRDGFPDVLAGAPYPQPAIQARVNIYRGGAATKPDGQVDWVLLGPDRSFGEAVASPGDINGDGFDDVCVGAPLDDTGSAPGANRGRVYVYYGSNVVPDGAFTGEAVDDRFGQAIAH